MLVLYLTRKGYYLKMNILIAEDEKIIQSIYLELLGDSYDLVFAEDGISCLEIINSSKPDLLILDVMMPRKNGIDICQELRSRYTKEQFPILMVSGNNSDELSQLCMNAGANRFLCKTLLSKEIAGIIPRLLDTTYSK